MRSGVVEEVIELTAPADTAAPRTRQKTEGKAEPAVAPASEAGASRTYRIAKRGLDMLVSAIGIVLSSPLMALIAAAIKIESRGPVLYGHVRLGKGGRPFRCLKFRSMRQGADRELRENPELRRYYVENDYKIPIEKDPRITRVGRLLRKSSLDELPQLFNVLLGSMTLVGPRPIVREELHWYGESADYFLSVKPGVTGIWQVQGRSRIGYPDRTQVELEGIRKASFWNDLKVLARSIPAVIQADGSL